MFRRITTNDYESIPNGWIINIIKKPLMIFTGTDPEHSVEDYLNAFTANLILNIGPEPVNTPLPQNWIHRRTALIQTSFDGAAQKWFSALPMEIKSDWKRFTQEISKCLIQKETNNIKEFYAMKLVDYPTKRLNNLQSEEKH